MFIGGLFILILVAAAAAVALVIVALSLAMVCGRGDEERYCGKCFYSTKGLPEERCPECGSDFKVVGLVNRPERPIWGTVAIVGAWAVLSPIVLFALSIPIIVNAPQHTYASSFEVWNGPASGAYRSVSIRHDTRSRTGWGGRSSMLEESTWRVDFESPAATIRLEGDQLRRTITAAPSSFAFPAGARLSASLLDDFLVQEYPDADHEALEREASEIHARVSHMIEPGDVEPMPAALGQMSNSYRSSYGTPVIGYPAAVLAIIGLIWTVGLIVVARWAHRRKANQ